MIRLEDWLSSTRFEAKPWLILGKGPTFAQRGEFDLGAYNLLSLNHVVAEERVDVAHIADLDVVEACADALRTNCRFLVMPRYPHVQFRPSRFRLEEFFDMVPVLRELDEAGRLVWYDLRGDWYDPAWAPPVGGSRPVEYSYFGSEPAFEILARTGAKVIRTLGVDGGVGYSGSFAGLPGGATLARAPFELQFQRIEAIAEREGIDHRPLVEPMRVYVGAAERELLPLRVLEHSLRKHASRPLRVIPMIDVPVPEPKDEDDRARTPFSFYRFVIPKLAGYRGRALYLDSDMLAFADVAELFDIPFGDRKVLVTDQGDWRPEAWKDDTWFHPGRQMSVMALDCERLDWDVEDVIAGLDEDRYTYSELLKDMCLVGPDEIADGLPPEWNHLERYEPGTTKLLHYTVIHTQPWKFAGNPLGHLWMAAFEEAVLAGAVPRHEIELCVEKGHVLPSFARYAELAAESPWQASTPLGRELQQAREDLEEARRQLDFVRRSKALRVGTAITRPYVRARGALRRPVH